MGTNDEYEALNKILNFTVPKIKSNVHFWMIRTQGGHFYEEFISDSYVAFGWNLIDRSSDLKSEELRKDIKLQYDVEQAGRVINKCDMFINDMQENDLVLIPNRGMEEIAIALVGEYYEIDSKTIDDEHGMLWKIKNRNNILNDIKCPYKKRRKITVLKTVKGISINYHLYKTLRNYHSIDDIDEHAVYILSMLFDTFVFDNNLHITLNVGQTKDIELYDLSGVLYGSSRYFSHYIEKSKITAKVNVCSEGQIFITLKDALELINTHGATFVGTFLGLFGGTYGIIKLKDAPKFLKDIFTLKESYKQEEIKTQLKTQELREKTLKNDLLQIEVEEKKRELEEKLREQCSNDLPSEFEQRLIAEASESLQLTANEMTPVGAKAISTIIEQDE